MSKILGILVSFFLFASCSLKSADSLKLESEQQTDSETSIPAEQLSFQIVSEKVLKKNCTGCHAQGAGNAGGINLETYANVFEMKALVRAEVFSRSMPPQQSGLILTDMQIKIVTDWIDQGAKETPDPVAPIVTPPVPIPEPQPPTAPPIVELSFKNVFEKVIKTNCLKCHSGSADVNLETYANVFDNRAAMKVSIENNSMPLLPRGKALTAEQKKLILDWLEVGAPE